MVRVVVSVLVALQTLMPPGMCVHKLGVPWCLTRSAADHDDQHSTAHPAVAERHVSKCCSGRRGPSVPVGVVVEGDSAKPCDEPSSDDRGTDPCSSAFCQAKSDKIVQRDYPQVDGVTTPFEIVPFEQVEDRPPPPIHIVAVTSAPPLYVIFCTFLI